MLHRLGRLVKLQRSDEAELLAISTAIESSSMNERIKNLL